MPGCRPKLLSVVTVPTGGWVFRLKITNGDPYNTNVDCTIAAGDYFVAWDNQSDDFLYAFMTAASAALKLSGVGNYSGADADGKPLLWIDTDHKVHVLATDSRQMQIDWTSGNGASVAAVLGFSSAAALTLAAGNSYTATADYHHAYGWYADEDGLLSEDSACDVPEDTRLQSFSPDGYCKTIHVGTRYRQQISLAYLDADKVWSNGKSYTEAPTHPYERNEGLECWWREAVQGKRFRFYARNHIQTAFASETGEATAGAGTTLTDAGKSWDLEPYRHVGSILYVGQWYGSSPARYRVSSHTATVLTVPNELLDSDTNNGDNTYHLFDQAYGTYILDSESRMFRPSEMPSIELYSISFRFARYVG